MASQKAALASATEVVRLTVCVLWALSVGTSARPQALHPSLGTAVLVGEAEIRIEAPGHISVVQKGGRLKVEGAVSIVEASAALAAWHLDHGAPAQAMPVVEAGLKQASKDLRLLLFAAIISERLDEPARALAFVERGLKVDANDPELHFLRGKALQQLGRSGEALAALVQAASVRPNDARYQCGLGTLYYELGQTNEAIAAFRAANDNGGGSRRGAYNLGAVLLEAGKPAEALRVYQSVPEPTETDRTGQGEVAMYARAMSNVGAIHLAMQDWDSALQAYGRALELDPAVPGGEYNQAYLYYTRGQLELAHAGYRRALELDASLPLAYLHLGEIELARGEASAAVQLLEEGSSRLDDTLTQRAYQLLGDAHRALGDVDASIRSYRSALERQADDLTALFALGNLLRVEGELSEARTLLERARTQDPTDSNIALELAALARAEGNLVEEKALYREVLTFLGEGEETWLVQLNLALLLLEEGETEEARRRLEPLLARLPAEDRNAGTDATSVSPHQAMVLATAYGMLLAKDGVLDEAVLRFEAVLAEAEAFAPALEALAVVAALEGKLDDASTRMTHRLDEADQGSSGAILQGNLGLVLWLSGHDSDGREYLRAAAQSFPDWLSVRVALVEAELQAGGYDAAIEHASKASKLCAGPAAVHTMLRAEGARPGRVLEMTLGGANGGGPLCERVTRSLAASLVGAALAELNQALADPRVRPRIRDRLDRAMALPLQPVDEPRALFARGTLNLLEGADEKARSDLAGALGQGLRAPLRSFAENNLGIALHNLGQGSEAERHFEAARAGTQAFAPATLNLGIALDERNENREALRLYEEYVSVGEPASRRQEVRAWIDNLRRIYR